MVISSRKYSSIIIDLYIIYLHIIIDDEHKNFVRRTNRSGMNANGAARTETQHTQSETLERGGGASGAGWLSEAFARAF